jgi:hypothetical protein
LNNLGKRGANGPAVSLGAERGDRHSLRLQRARSRGKPKHSLNAPSEAWLSG